MNKLIWTLLLVLVAYSSNAQETKTFSLLEAMNYGVERSLSLKNAKLNMEDAQQQIYETRSIGLPKVNASVEYQHFIKLPKSVFPAFGPQTDLATIEDVGGEDRQVSYFIEDANGNPVMGDPLEIAFGTKNNLTGGISMSSLLFDGSYIVGLRAAKFYKEYVAQEYSVKEREVRNNIMDAYLPVLVLEENKGILNKNIKNLEKLLFETKEMYKAGFVEQLDVDRLELSLANIKTELDLLDRQEQTVYTALKFQMNIPLEEEIKVADNIESLFVEAGAEDLEGDLNPSARPELGLVDKGIQLNQLDIERYKAGYLPSLAVYASYNYQFQGRNIFNDSFGSDNAVVGLQLNIPIFDGYEKRSKIERAKIRLLQAQNQKQDLERALEVELDVARKSYGTAYERVRLQKKNMGLAERIYETTKIKYKEGVGSSLEMSQAEQALFQSQSNYTNALFDLLVAKKALDKALGK